VLIYSPRWNGERVQNTDLAEELASHGYVVAAIDHPYNAERVLLGDGRVIEADQALEGPKGTAATASDRIAHWNRTLDIWAADDVFVLNRLAAENVAPATSFHGKLDTDHAGAFGHSFGGASSLRLCGLDPRIKAAVNMDGWTFGGLQSRTSAQQVLLMYEQVPEAPAGTVEGDLDRADDDALTRSLTRYGGYRMRIQGTQHMDFSDQPLLPPLRRTGSTGPIPAEEIERILRAYVVRFFDRTLKGKPAGVLAAPKPPFAEVTLETWPAKP
jgi:dienelactone hydrolase